MKKTKLIFVLDPMCSWCWGFAPIIETLRSQYQEKYNFSILLGGLRQTMPWNTQSKTYLKQNWDAITIKTSQKFSYHLLNQSHFNYNTYPSCKAVITVRELWGEDKAFEYAHKIQEAFYTKSKNITDINILSAYIEEKHSKEKFLNFYHSQEAETLMQEDFKKARAMGVNSFPSVIKIDTDEKMILMSGYKEVEEILNA